MRRWALAVLCAGRVVLAANELELVAPPVLPQGTVGVPYAQPLPIDGGTPPYTYQLVLPVGRATGGTRWALDGGWLTGTPSATDPYGTVRARYAEAVRVVVVDATGRSGQKVLEIDVVADGGVAVATRSPLLPAVTQAPYEVALLASQGVVPFVWSVPSGALPPGLTLSAQGSLHGAPAAAGSYAFTVQVTDARGQSAAAPMALEVYDGALPLTVGFDAGAVVRVGTPRLGTNVPNTTGTYWDDSGFVNQWLPNPGLEPARARRMYRAWAGGPGTLEEWDLAQWPGIAELDTGYWNGGRYWLWSMAAVADAGSAARPPPDPVLLRTGMVDHYVRLADAGTPSGWKGVWTLADSDPQRVARATSSYGQQDIFMVESAGTNASHAFGRLPPDWMPQFPWGTTAGQVFFDVDATNRHAGAQSAKVTSTATGTVGLFTLVVWDNPVQRLRADTRYHYSAWVRQSGSPSGHVTVGLKAAFGTATLGETVASVPDDGRFHRVEGELQGGGQAAVALAVVFDGPGTLWVDDAALWEASSTVTRPHGTASPAVTARPFAPLPFVAADLRRMRAGTLRFWYYGLDVRLAEALQVPSPDDATAGSRTIPLDLWLAEAVGAQPWITLPKEWTPEEAAALVEYLASPDTTQGMGRLRASHCHPAPWTQTFSRIYLEYSDEGWNTPQYAYPFDLWHPELYASFARARFAAMRASPSFDGAHLKLIANGQLGDDFWVNDPVEAMVWPLADALDNAPYTGPALELGWADGARQMLGWDVQTTATMANTVGLWRARGHSTQLYVYEGGPGPIFWNPPTDEDARTSSVFYAALFLDQAAALFSAGVDVYNQFTYQNSFAWKAVTGKTSRLTYPTGYAMQLFNEAAGGLDEVAVSQAAPAPALTPLVRDVWPRWETMLDAPPVPAVSVRAYVGQGRVAFVSINRNPAAGYPLRLLTGTPAATFTVRTLAADGPSRGILEGPAVATWSSAPMTVDPSQLFEGAAPSTQMLTADGAGALRLFVPAGAVVTAFTGTPPGQGTDAPSVPGSCPGAGASLDAGFADAGAPDAGFDAGSADAGAPDAGFDAGSADPGKVDAGEVDAGLDARILDAGEADAGGADGGAAISVPLVGRCGCSFTPSAGLWVVVALVFAARRRR